MSIDSRRTPRNLLGLLGALASAIAACGGHVEAGPGTSSGTSTSDGGGSSGGDSGSGSSTNPKSAACWGCVEMSCTSQLDACAKDSSCKSALPMILGCANQDRPTDCYLMDLTQDTNPDLKTTLDGCLAKASNDCGCEGASHEDASSGCVPMGGGSSGGNGECTSDFSETCGGTTYQIVCACPTGTCSCFSGSSTKVVTFSGCPYCPATALGGSAVSSLLDMCGFPQ